MDQTRLRTRAICQTLVIQHNFPKTRALVAMLKARTVVQIKILHGRNVSEIADSVADLWKGK